ncbi:MAG: hypothetical protein KFF77_09365 [Bacteroidetes bacterium]|nr:hypothetical protein [Bacteroidota bacterium]
MSDGRITTPRELDAAGRALIETLRSTHSPQLQLQALVSFHDGTAHLPFPWRKAYLLPQLRTLLRLLLHPYTTGLPPRLWQSAWHYFEEMRENVRDETDAGQAGQELLCKLALSHGCACDFRSLHAFLLNTGTPLRDLDEQQWRAVYGAGPDPFAMFEAYCMTQEAEDSHHPLRAALLRWSAWRLHAEAVSVVLLEEGAHDAVAGAVLRMEIATRRGSGGVHINNVLGADADMTREQLLGARRLAAAFAQARIGHRFDTRDVYYQIIDLHAAFSGGSLGLAATVGLICHLSGEVNARVRWTLPADTACIASLDEDGALESVPWDTIRRKIALAFFSPLRRIVIPAHHVEAATTFIQELQRSYPQRAFEVLAASTFHDCFRSGHAVETMTRNPYDRLQTLGRRHARTGVLLAALLALGAALFLFYRSYIIFPDLEVTQGIHVPTNAIVYNPNDSLDWALRDGKQVLDASLAYGNLEVGDGFSRVFTVYNMTPMPKDVFIAVEGADPDQWYINAGGGAQQLASVIPLRLSVMYAPTGASSGHHAALVFRDGAGGRELFRIVMHGAAGRAIAGGYALRLDGSTQFLTWGKEALAFTNGDLTFEAWVRSLSWNGCLLHNGVGMSGSAERSNVVLGFDNGTPQVSIGDEHITVPLESTMKPDMWYHIALSYSVTRSLLRLIVDGKNVLERRQPLVMPDRMTPFVSLGAFSDSLGAGRFLDCEVDNLRVWWHMLDEGAVQRNMQRTLPGGTPGLKANFPMELFSHETAFNNGGDSPDAELRGRPSFVRSAAPLSLDISLPVPGAGPLDKPALFLPPGSYLRFARQVLPRHSDATFAFWWFTGTKRSTAMVVQNLGQCIGISGDTVATLFSGCRSDILGAVAPGWHHVAVRVLRDGRKEVFIDGAQRASVEACPSSAVPHDWHEGYEGITFGVYDDTYTAMSARQHRTARESLSRTRRIADVAIWKRLLSNDELAMLAEGVPPPPDHLVAFWSFDQSPTVELNIIDKVSGQLLHVRRAAGYR